jgi:hypothetical protein
MFGMIILSAICGVIFVVSTLRLRAARRAFVLRAINYKRDGIWK